MDFIDFLKISMLTLLTIVLSSAILTLIIRIFTSVEFLFGYAVVNIFFGSLLTSAVLIFFIVILMMAEGDSIF